ncbi:xanthine dehydrogenase family protein molybdopterin-binding subunit [Marinobacterium sedimentorum]|uniref:xanthine dehydrogenase family protein molybdopterin-binding subunit n=1 Tax=Marinobacterium sedimentorum TaxID=2927804 RepID=UPI0020C5D351|nr:molybdopterin cofactor-binding domain-containing protein [Marinobacterium sedimentorum]MCP8687715.1 molybdopterin-dependent oxidoreductase [Marinobacterium sedimentorum]
MKARNAQNIQLPRRRFLKQGALLTSGLAVGFHWSSAAVAATAPQDDFEPNAWVRVLPDGTVKLVVHKHDSGTGTRTALAACVAEELEVDPMAVEVITPENPFFEAYMHPLWHVFSTGGSTSISLEYDRLRQAGAMAREMLVAAAAARWGLAPADCRARDGRVHHDVSGRTAGYGELTEAAAKLPAPEAVRLKAPSEFRYIGKLRHKRDALEKVSGRLRYSIDVELPGMLVAVVLRAPVIDARVEGLDTTAALQVPGVRQVIRVPARPDVLGGNQEGVAVLADDYWSAQQGREVLQLRWSQSAFAEFDSDALPGLFAAAIEDPARPLVRSHEAGDVDGAWPLAARLLEADYGMPYKAQNPLEPVCVTAELADGRLSFWGGVQVPSFAREAARTICGLGEEQVVIHELISGGSFGAREAKYWLMEAAYLAQQAGKPVKLMNSREDEVRALFGHAATLHRLKGALDADGGLSALRLRALSPASGEQWEPGYDDRPDQMDYSTTEAISAWDFAYHTPHLDLGWVRYETGVPTGWYRSVSFIPNVFAVESFMDELAQAAGRDPLDFRLAHMQERPRHVRVLQEAAELAGWGRPLPQGTALGLATHQGYGSYVAVVARLSRQPGGLRVERLSCVVDCGLAVSPGGVEEQIYGGLMWGLGHALFDRIDIRQGAVVQSNFHDYRVARMSDMPEIEIRILEGDPDKPGGVGELTSPPVAPAIANAIQRLTGQRLRETPLDLGLKA